MPLAVTAALDLSTPASPFYLVTVLGLSGVAGASTVTVEREYPDYGAITPPNEIVRGLFTAPVSGDSLDAQDFEVKFLYAGDVRSGAGSFNYHAHVYNTTGAEIANVSVSVSNYRDATLPTVLTHFPRSTVLLQSVTTPALNVPASFIDFANWSTPGRILSTNNVLGRANPVVIGDAMGGRTGTFNLLVSTEWSDGGLHTGGQDLDFTEQLLIYNDVLIFNPYYGGLGLRPMYFKVTGYTTTRLTNAQVDKVVAGSYVWNPDLLYFQVSVDFIEVDDPATTSQGPVIATWQDILDNFATWADVLAHRSDWLDVLNRATEGP